MTKDQVKQHLVCINQGSGVIFQPAVNTHSYILTAKHVLKDSLGAGKTVNISRYDLKKDKAIDLNPFSLIENKNYFPHATKDIAIVIVERLEVHHDLGTTTDFNSSGKEYALFGFPGARRKKENFLDRLREDAGLTFSIEKANGVREATLLDNSTWIELQGQSGGGIFKTWDTHLALVGIQSGVPTTDEAKGRIEFYPIDNFEEIVSASGGVLEPLLPYYIKSFSFLEKDIFNIKGSLGTKPIEERLNKILIARAEEISKGDFAPKCIREFLGEKLLLLHGQHKEEVFSRKLWRFWLELLTILNIAKDKKHRKTDFQDIFRKLRLFYSDIDDDFFVAHIHDLAFASYEGLEAGGLVVVSSRQIPRSNAHHLNIDKIPGNISQVKEEFAIQRGPSIDTSTDFPLTKFRFSNISAFKENILDQGEDFKDLSLEAFVKKLKELYVALIK